MLLRLYTIEEIHAENHETCGVLRHKPYYTCTNTFYIPITLLLVQFFMRPIIMSIAALKRKSLTLYGSSHCNKQGQFSLNGVIRQLPYTLGRSVTRTPFRGPYPMGHGEGGKCRVSGWRHRVCGNGYPIIISNSGSCIVPQTEVKRSTMNNAGMIESRYKGILHGAPAHVHRVDRDQGTYLQKQTDTCRLPPVRMRIRPIQPIQPTR